MGYWSKHPMAGDPPMDFQLVIIDKLFTNDEFFNDEIYTYEEFRKRLSEQIEEVYKEVKEELNTDARFVLPFTIARYRVKIKDEVLSKKIRKMIDDGGNETRKYDSTPIPTKDNNYTNFDRPICYANQLRDLWNYLMKDESKFDDLEEYKGLFDTIIEDTIKKGLINVD